MKSDGIRTARPEFLTRERCYIRELVNDPAVGAFSLALARVEPGVQTELHRLTVDEWYVIDSGAGSMEIGGRPAGVVGPGDVRHVPAGTSQRIKNTGEADLLFHCVCLPRFTADAYEGLEGED